MLLKAGPFPRSAREEEHADCGHLNNYYYYYYPSPPPPLN
jgi:hypothetical protein